MAPRITLAGFDVGLDMRPQVFVEIGINHGGDLATAKQMASAALERGATFIKHQTHIPESEMSREAEKTIPGNSDLSIFDIMKKCALDFEEERELADFVQDKGGVFFSTPFSREAVDRLEALEVPFYKIGSGECNNYPFVDFVASTGKPVVVSTGMNNLASVKKTVDILESRSVPFALLHTTNLYPTPSELLRLGGVSELAQNFHCPIGLSDHSISNAACLGAVALGASILERHFVDSKSRIGPDVVCSMDPDELSQLLDWSNQLFLARGGSKGLLNQEQVTANFAFASVSSIRDIREGEALSLENCFPIRPGTGEYPPDTYESLLGRRVNQFVPARTQISKDMIA